MRMEHSKNFYGLFVVCRYVCEDVIIINFTSAVFIQTCLRFYLVLHRSPYMFINYFVLLKWLSAQHRFFTLITARNKASLIYHLLFSKVYIDKTRLIILCRVS